MSYPSCLITNSYNILGLSCSASLTEVRKSSQLMLQLVKIDEIKHFKTDIGDPLQYRTESKIRKAQEKLSSIKERLYETFFWLETHTAVNKKVIQLIAQKNCQEATAILEKSKNIKTDWLSRKNLALSFLFMAFSKSDISAFKKALDLWKQIKESQIFWNFYEKYYCLHDEIGTSSSFFKDFQKELCKFLAKISGEFYKLTKDPAIIEIYYYKLGHIDKTIDREILQPVIFKIKELVEKIEEIVEAEDSEKKFTLDSLLHSLSKEHINLCNFGLCAYSPIAVLKNNIADRLRAASVTINNKDEDYDLAILLVLQAEKFASSKIVLEEIQKDKKIFSENQKYIKNQRYENFIEPRVEKLKKIISNKEFEKAKKEYLYLDNELAEQNDEASHVTRIDLLIDYCLILEEKGHELFDKKVFDIKIHAIDVILNRKNYKRAISIFEYILKILTDSFHLLKFKNPQNDPSNLLTKIENISNDLKTCELTSFIEDSQSYLDTINKLADRQENENTRAIMMLAGRSVCYSILYRRMRNVKQRKMWKWIGWGAAIIFCFLRIMNSDNTVSNSAYSSALTYQEKQIIDYLQKNDTKALNDIRKEGFSDKEIAQYVIKYDKEKK